MRERGERRERKRGREIEERERIEIIRKKNRKWWREKSRR